VIWLSIILLTMCSDDPGARSLPVTMGLNGITTLERCMDAVSPRLFFIASFIEHSNSVTTQATVMQVASTPMKCVSEHFLLASLLTIFSAIVGMQSPMEEHLKPRMAAIWSVDLLRITDKRLLFR
jgi:hypothetical protein